MLKKKYIIINVLIALLSLIIQYNGVCTIRVLNAAPMLPLAFVVVLSMFSSELFSFFLGLVIGIVIDAVSTTGFGFNTIVFSIVGVSVSFLVHYLFNNNVKSSIVLTALISFVYFAIRFLIFFPSVNATDSLTYIFKTGIPSAILTSVFGTLIFILQKSAYKNTQIRR